MHKFTEEVAKLIAKETKLNLEEISKSLEFPPNLEMGDLAFPCFSLSKKMKRNPIEISNELAGKIKSSGSIKEVKSMGPYLNFFIKPEKLAESVLEEISTQKKDYGSKKSSGKTILVEFPAPNTNKPLHVGHVRNMCIGESISRILETQGHTVFRVNLNNDRGVHICKSMLSYQKWGKNTRPDKKSDHFVGEFYVLFAKKAKDSPGLEKEAQELLRLWEAKDDKTRALWKKMNKWALDGFKETYKNFGIRFDKEYFESEMYEKGKEIVNTYLKKGVFRKGTAGEVLIDLGKEIGKKVLLRADGTTVYITQDLYLAELKYKDYAYDKSIYVVGSEQKYHFKVLFEILKRIKFKGAKGCYHLSYGMVNLPEGKLKSREGTVVDADDLLEEVAEAAEKEIKKRQNVSVKEAKELSLKIALSAIKYFMLKHYAQKDFIFRPKESISFEGNTGPYIQYSLVRANKILEKSTEKIRDKVDFSLLTEKEEIKLIKKLSLFGEILEETSKNYAPNILAEYVYSLANLFSQFYEKCPVIQEDKKRERSRIFLIQCFTQVLEKGLNLLGIDAVSKM